MPKAPITTFSNLTCRPSPTNSYNAIYIPQLTTAQVGAISVASRINGAIIYNINRNVFQVYQANMWVDLNPAAGYVVGPAMAADNNIATFDGTTGKLIKDSGVVIGRVPVAFASSLSETPLVNVNEIGNLGHIRFQYGTNDIGLIFVDSLMAVEFITNNYSGSNYQVCSLFTGGLPSSSTTPSALVELQSTTGALLLSRLTTTQVGALTAPAAGMIAYNSTANQLINYTNGAWGSVYVSPGLTNNLVLQNNSTDPTGTNGLIYYNTTSNIIKTYVNGSYGSVYVSPGSTTNLIVQSTTTDPANTNGTIYYNTSTNTYRCYQNGAWSNIYSSPSTATGAGLAATNNPFILPTNTDPSAVESGGNEVNGFMYCFRGNALKLAQIRFNANGWWSGIYSSPSIATGIGLDNGNSPFTLPIGSRVTVEDIQNQVNGFMYYAISPNFKIRSYTNGAWGTVPSAIPGITCGQAAFVAFATGVTISTSAITTSSIVLVTPSTGAALYVADVGTFVVSNIINNTSFNIILQHPVSDAFIVSWLIINP
jgi:hypothetical protein